MPPSTGATTGASSPGQTMYEIVRGMSGLAVRASTTSRPTGTMSAPPRPCSTRGVTSSVRLVLAAQPTEARVNSAIAVRKIRRGPNLAVSQPLSGMNTARVNR